MSSSDQFTPLRPETSSPQPSAMGWALLLSVFAALAAIGANRLLYQTQAPFFDSLSYYDKLHQVMTASREGGLFEGLQTVLKADTTVCLPFLIAVPLAWLLPPCREIGIGIQAIELFLFLWSLDLALRRLSAASLSARRTIQLSFFTLACLYYQNGGLSDFRMDLSLMLLYGCSALWLLMALQDGRRSSFVWLGLSVAAASLFRATAPIYFAFAFGPIIVWQLVLGQRTWYSRRQLIWNLLLSGSVATLAAGWYYLVNFDFLYYYYFVWNTDANARLPWLESLGHIGLVKRAIGDPGVVFFGLLAVIGLIGWNRGRQSQRPGSLVAFRIPLQWIWLGVAPTLLLVLLRAGLNPFVSMPTAIGVFLLFALWFGKWFDLVPPRQLRLIWTCLLIVLAICGIRGWKKHQISPNGSMASHWQLIEQIAADARQTGLPQARYDTLQLTELSAVSLWSTLLFDFRRAEPGAQTIAVDGIPFIPAQVFNQPASSDWANVPGGSDREKVEQLIAAAGRRVDYLIVAEPESVPEIQHALNSPVINTHLPALREVLIASKEWVPLAPAIETKPGRKYAIYRHVGAGERITRGAQVSREVAAKEAVRGVVAPKEVAPKEVAPKEDSAREIRRVARFGLSDTGPLTAK